MGRLSNEPIIQHFSHTHPLQLSSLDQLQQQSLAPPILCANCRLPARGGYGYACSPCSYVLHVQCSEMPPLIHHASHQAHPLSLLPVPAYPDGSFHCDACAKTGTGFSYHCRTCGVDLHTLCASLPLSLPNAALHAHPLALTFAPPYENKAFSCDVCGGMGSNQWLYRCAPCEFDAHLECGGGRRQPPPSPAPRGVQQQQQAVVGRSGSVVVQGSPRAVAMSRSGSGGMVRQMVQGLVSTTTHQIGSRFVPGYVGDGTAGANGGGRGGGPGGAWNGPNQGGRGRGRGGGGIGYNGWNENGGGGGPPGAWNGYGGGRGQGGGGPSGAWNGYGGGRGQGGGPPGAWNDHGGGRGQGGGGPGAGSDPNGAQASYDGNGGGNGDGSGAQASYYDNGGNGDGSGDWNGYVDSSAGDVSGGWNGYDGGDGGGGNGDGSCDGNGYVDSSAGDVSGGWNGYDGGDGGGGNGGDGVDYGSVVEAVDGVN